MTETSHERMDVLAQLIERERWAPCRYDTAVIPRSEQVWYRIERLLADSLERTVVHFAIAMMGLDQ